MKVNEGKGYTILADPWQPPSSGLNWINLVSQLIDVSILQGSSVQIEVQTLEMYNVYYIKAR